mgnify:CR=1 FL=1
MARKTIQSNYYLFDASAREVIIPGGVQRENLILITNVVDNKVIYNFSDPELTATTYSIQTDIRNVTTTRIVLAYDTTSMSDADELQIIVDDFEDADLNHDGRLSFAEFQKWYGKAPTNQDDQNGNFPNHQSPPATKTSPSVRSCSNTPLALGKSRNASTSIQASNAMVANPIPPSR